MWSEKYRPRRLEDLIDQSTIVDGLRNLLKAPAAIPHLLFSGPPGSGKTTMALIVSKTILGPYVDDYALILNASDERKLEVVREKIKTFARYFDRRAGVPFRLVILDEADEMTRDAQTALRRIMEDHSSYTRFILTCNYSSDIIEPIQSRCTLFRFTRLAGKDIADFLEKICKNEKVRFTQEGLNLIHDVTGGDVRHAVNTLQACASMGEVSVPNVEKIAGISAKAFVGQVIKDALSGNFTDARSKMIECLRVYGIMEKDFIRFAYEATGQFRTDESTEIAEIFAKYDSRLTSSATPEIQLSALLAELSRLKRKT
ncbi:MAG: replication factor C small subunit [Thaumarchaeota archaeon]|nr:replication factor C small subunit [Nitrososphaerota archaeon]|tara:strand:+ start:1344 stop:2288 length:945 start_codon:yes stop_codon:yes gene_type:complete